MIRNTLQGHIRPVEVSQIHMREAKKLSVYTSDEVFQNELYYNPTGHFGRRG
jgi:hypothetical protein